MGVVPGSVNISCDFYIYIYRITIYISQPIYNDIKISPWSRPSKCGIEVFLTAASPHPMKRRHIKYVLQCCLLFNGDIELEGFLNE